MPTVSVVIPTRDRAELLSRTVAAALGQQDVKLELVVVDDGSADHTAEAVAALTDERIRFVRNDSPRGVAAARNRGIAVAGGAWVAFCDDDDLWAPDKLAAQLRAAHEAGAGWVYTGDVNIDDRLRVLSGGPPPDPETVLERMPRLNPIVSGGSNVLVRADLLAEAGGFDEALRRTEDWDLWIRLTRLSMPAWVCRPLVAYRFHGSNTAGDLGEMVSEPQWLAERYGIAVDIAAMHRRAAWTALRGGRRGIALRHYAQAVARGDLRSIGRAAVTVLHPDLSNQRLFGWVASDPGWVADAERWLAVLRGEPSPGDLGRR
jgi:glycosyltransferase involved in cell wall biosynthesis